MAMAGKLSSPLMLYKMKAFNNSIKRERPQALGKNFECGKRDFFLLSAAAFTVADSRTELLNKYLKKSEENKAKNEKERLDSYYKRNYRDYFGLLEGELKQKKDISESEVGILKWLERNK